MNINIVFINAGDSYIRYLISSVKLKFVATLVCYFRFSFNIFRFCLTVYVFVYFPGFCIILMGLCIIFLHLCIFFWALCSLFVALYSLSGLCIVFWGCPHPNLSPTPPPHPPSTPRAPRRRQRQVEALRVQAATAAAWDHTESWWIRPRCNGPLPPPWCLGRPLGLGRGHGLGEGMG